MKPESWKTLPNTLLETILWDIDSLDYCSYESSKTEVIHEILYGSISSLNQKIVDAYWKALSEITFELRVCQQLESVKRQVEALEKLINKA